MHFSSDFNENFTIISKIIIINCKTVFYKRCWSGYVVYLKSGSTDFSSTCFILQTGEGKYLSHHQVYSNSIRYLGLARTKIASFGESFHLGTTFVLIHGGALSISLFRCYQHTSCFQIMSANLATWVLSQLYLVH